MIIRNSVEGVRTFIQREFDRIGWTVRELSEESGISDSAIRKFISDDPERQTRSPHFRTVYHIVRALGWHLRIENK